MANLTSITDASVITMSSREIAELVEKRHDNVKRTIESLATKSVISVPQIEEYRDSLGRTAKEYKIGKRDCFVIVAQLSPEFTARVVDRWQELEAHNSIDPIKALSDPSIMRGLLLSYTEKVITLKSKVEELEPKAEALDRIATHSEGSFCIRDAAKTLQVKEKVLCKKLLELGWLYRRPMGSGYLAYADKLKRGFMEHKVTRGEKYDGSEWIGTQARITAKGLARLAEIISNNVRNVTPV